jgi:muconolactone delta-isomerase
MLIKAQVLREMGTCFPSSMDSDYANYLKGLERATIEAITNEGAMDRYLRESRRLTLEEWLDTLDWGHCTR